MFSVVDFPSEDSCEVNQLPGWLMKIIKLSILIIKELDFGRQL